MSTTINYPFTTPSNYSYDTSKVEVTGGVAKLKFQEDTGKTFAEDFADDTDFIYDNTKAEFVGGAVRQKDRRPGSNATFGVNYNSNINGNWGEGVLTGTAIGGAGVSGGKLDLTGGGKSVNYDANLNADSQQVGCVRFKFTPNFTGSPPTDYPFFTVTKANGDADNIIMLRHDSSGNIQIFIEDSTGASITNVLLGIWSNIQDTEYEFELNWDITTGATRLFIDGIQFGSTQTDTGTRDSNIAFLNVGGNYNNAQFNDGYIEDFIIFSTVQHTANYTPGYSIADYVYGESKVELPQFIYSGAGSIQGFVNFVTTESGVPKQIWNDLYYNGGWVASNGSYAQSNTKAEILAQIVTFPLSDTLEIDVAFPDSNSIQSNIDDLTVSYTGQIYPVDNPTIEVNSSFKVSELLSFSETSTKTGSDEIKHIIKVNGIDKYYSGGLQTSDGTYAQSNTAAEILANIGDFLSTRSTVILKSFLHSDDGSATPELDLISIIYDAALPDPSLPTLTELEGYLYNNNGPITSSLIKIRPYLHGFINIGVFHPYTWADLATTNADGWFESDIYVQPSGEYWELKIGGQRYYTQLVDQTLNNLKDLTLELIEEDE